jgi:acyl-CoA synthetase (AMP-forming)/AMP-acid ligase II
MYLDGKYGLRKDIRELRKVKAVTNLYIEAGESSHLHRKRIVLLTLAFETVTKKRISLYYFFEDAVKRKSNNECLWSREGCHTWGQTYDRANEYAQWFLSQGVKPHDYVAFYLTNSPDFIFAWLGLWAIGAAPAMINYNLAGSALIHCLKVSGATLLLVDEDQALGARIGDARGQIEGELGMKIRVMDSQAKKDIRSQNAERPADSYREGVKGDWAMAMFYTSGTTGMPKGVPYQIDRGYASGATVQTFLHISMPLCI